MNRFNLKQWLPKSLYWYGQVMLPPAVVWSTLLAMLLTWIVVIHRYAADWPFWDDLGFLPHIVGAQPFSWEFLWAHHNGHRLVIPKLVYFGAMKISGYQPIVLMYVSAAVLAFGTCCVLIALRRARGRMHVLDAALVLTALSVSQYQNLLWAFQIGFTMPAALVLLAIAVAIDIHRTTGHRHIMLIGAITTLLPFFGGLGMGIAPGLFLWLFGIGLIYFVRGVDRNDRTFAAWSFAAGLIAAGAWSLAVHGLPPSTALQTTHDAVRSWAAFRSFVSHLYSTSVEVFSTPFLSEAMDKGLPFLYDGRAWGHVGLFLLVSGAAILMAAWIRRPQERLRIAAIAGCLMGAVTLTFALYFSRGVYGPGAGAVARYATVAMPPLAIAIVTYGLYAPRLLRLTVLLTIATANLGLLYGPHGNLARVRAFAGTERDRSLAFAHELSRPGGTTIEELTSHFAAALFGPGDARKVPHYIELMAEYRIGPFHVVPVIPPRIVSWNASPFPLHAHAVYGATWDGRTAVKSVDTFGVIRIVLTKPTPISALRLTFRFKAPSVDDVLISWSWHPPDTREFDSARHDVRWWCSPSSTIVQTGIVYIFSTVARIDIGLGPGLTEWELLNSEHLEPTVTASQ